MGILVEVVDVDEACADLTDLAVVFPAYNEESNVARAMETALDVGVGLVVCVDDCSTDRTGEIMEGFRGRARVELVHHQTNQGKQAAVKHGLQAAVQRRGVEKFATLDADMQDDPAELKRVAAPVGAYDLAVAYRLRNEMPAIRRMANSLANIPYRCLCGLRMHDVQAAFRIYSRPVARYLAEHLAVEGGYTLEHTSMPLFGEIARQEKRHVRIAEVRTPCPYGEAESHIGFTDNVRLTLAAVQCAWQLARRLRGT